MKETEKVDWEQIMEIIQLEDNLNVKFPQSYRQFLLEKGSAVIAGYQIFGLPEKKPREKEIKEEKGILLDFQLGDPRREGFAWISNYQERIVGLCSRPDCWFCNLEEREKLKDFQGGELRVNLIPYQRASRKFGAAYNENSNIKN